MLFFAAKEFLAVDLGTHTVKVLVLSERKGRWRVTNLHTIQTGVNAQTPPDQVLSRQGAALTALLKSAGLRKKDCVSAIPGGSAFFRPLRIPSVGGERLDRIVRYEARQQIPFPLDQVIYDFHQFQSVDSDVDVTLVAAKKDLINEHVDMLQRAGLNVEMLDVSTLALYNSFVAGHPTLVNEVVAVIDIGAATTDLVISVGGTLRFMRSAKTGGNHLTQQIATLFAIPIEEAEQLKVRTFAERDDNESVQLHLARPGENRVVDAVHRGMEDIIKEVRRSLDYFVSRPEGVPVNTVILTGGSSRIPGIRELFEDRLGLDVMLEPGFTVNGFDLDRVDPRDYASCGVVMGLALKAAQKVAVDMNFTPVTIRQRQAIEERRPSFLLEAGLVACTIGLLIANVYLELRLNRDVLENMKSVNNLVGLAPELRQAIQAKNALGSRLNKLQHISRNRGYLSAVWAEMSRLKPEGVWVESATMVTPRPNKPGGLGIIGRAEQASYVRDFVTNLGVSPYFKQTRVLHMAPERGSIKYNIQVRQLVRPLPAVLHFINGIRVNLRKLSEGKRAVEVRTAYWENQKAWVYYTHVDVDGKMLEALNRAAASALVEAVAAGGDNNKPSNLTLTVVALGLRGDPIPGLAKRVTFDAAEKLHRNEITYEEYQGLMKEVSDEVKAEREAQARAAAQAPAAAPPPRPQPAAPRGGGGRLTDDF